MLESQVEKMFKSFLIEEKGYPTKALLVDAKLFSTSDSSRFAADLLILDTQFQNYLAIVEFKNSTEFLESGEVFLRKALYFLSKPDLPAYLVVGGENYDFEIFSLSSQGMISIEKNDFPEYETLQSKVQTDVKYNIVEQKENIAKEVKKKRDILKGTAFYGLVSLAVGVIAIILFTYTTLSDNNVRAKHTDLINDSAIIEISKLSKKLAGLQMKIDTLNVNDSVLSIGLLNQRQFQLQKQISALDSSLSTSPERLLKLQEITFELREVQNSIEAEKQLSELKISNLKDRVDQVVIWTSGLMITIIGSIIGFAINAFRKSK